MLYIFTNLITHFRKMRRFSLFLSVMAIFLTVGCNQKNAKIQDLPEGMHAATVIEAIQGGSYSYFNVFEDNNKFWMATNPLQAKEGDIIYYTRAFEMKDFNVKEINKTFESIMFVEDAALTFEKKTPASPGKLNPNQVADLNITKPEGAITLEELFKDKQKYNGKEVTIRGLVVKYNSNIMNSNWAHIQDGTKHDNSYDLTITTNDVIAPGQILTFKGVITLDKDFGHGYAYDVIMMDAKTSEPENYEPPV